MAGPRKSGKKEKKRVPKGIAHINSTFNNTHVAFTDVKGNVVCWATGGTENFKNSRKSTPFAAQLAAENAAKKAVDFGIVLKVQVLAEKVLLEQFKQLESRLLLLETLHPFHTTDAVLLRKEEFRRGYLG